MATRRPPAGPPATGNLFGEARARGEGSPSYTVIQADGSEVTVEVITPDTGDKKALQAARKSQNPTEAAIEVRRQAGVRQASAKVLEEASEIALRARMTELNQPLLPTGPSDANLAVQRAKVTRLEALAALEASEIDLEAAKNVVKANRTQAKADALREGRRGFGGMIMDAWQGFRFGYTTPAAAPEAEEPTDGGDGA